MPHACSAVARITLQGLTSNLLDMEQPLLQLLQVLENQMAASGRGDGGLGQMGRGGLAAAALAGPGPGLGRGAGAAAAEGGEPAAGADPVTAAMQQLANAFGVPMNQLQQGGVPAQEHVQHRRALPQQQPPQQLPEPEPAQDIVAPAPPAAAIDQLTAMGFTEPAARKVRG